ncbi:MAG: NAD(P)H-binding protein [Peptococcaceae bacterium]|nr:NAD(P)H-binding protein [Peptococcaceae bacterium]
MKTAEINVVTGAFGYTGKYIARLLLEMGKQVRTITGHPGRTNPFGDRVSVFPFNFDNPPKLVESLRGATTLYNTYWVRFARGQVTFDTAVENTRTLIGACAEAGVRRIVHVSITNASEDSPLPYFRGKGLLEKSVIQSGLSYAIIRPTVIFGPEDILINNIAWLLRRFPVFAVPGPGDCRLQPIFVQDMARVAVRVGQQSDNIIMDVVGPEIFTFNDLVRLIAGKIGSRSRIVHVSPGLALFLSRLIGYTVNDVLLTSDEVRGLLSDLLVSQDPPAGETRLSDWLEKNSGTVGVKYASELRRHYR